MRERPILFSAPMVSAILDGRKSQTRRIVKPQPPSVTDVHKRTGDGFHLFTDHLQPEGFRVAGGVGVVRELMGDAFPRDGLWRCPYGAIGDRLWVKETHQVIPMHDDDICVYRASCYDDSFTYADSDGCIQLLKVEQWRPSIFMRRLESRITLEVTGVRVERLHAITEEDARAEGVERAFDGDRDLGGWEVGGDLSCRTAFEILWKEINGAESWNANLFVWVVEFRRVEVPT